jgi:hypothetical protein
MITDIFCFYLQNRLIQNSHTGGQWYSDTSPFSIPCSKQAKQSADVFSKTTIHKLIKNWKPTQLASKMGELTVTPMQFQKPQQVLN